MTKTIMATVSLIQMLAAGCANSDGTPAASARARFYAPSTLTPATVYADSAAATPITPPLVLTAGGTGIAYTQQPTRMILKDSTDSLTLFDGNVNTTRAESEYITSAAVNGGTETRLQTWLDAFTTSFGGSAGLWKFKLASNATERNMTSVIGDLPVSVKNFGAVGDGVTDDRAAIQAALDYVATLGGGTVYLPPGTFIISTALQISQTGTAIVGSSSASTVIKNTNTGGNAIIAVAAAVPDRLTFRNFRITHSSSSTGFAITDQAGTGMTADALVIDGHATGISAGIGAGGTLISNCVVTTSAASTSGALAVLATATVVGGLFSSASGSGIAVAANATASVFGAVTNVGGITGIDVASGASLYAYGVTTLGAAIGLRTNAAASAVHHQGCNWGSAGATDGRTGAPVAYTFAADGNFTPLPMQTDAIRVNVTAAAVVTINAIAKTGFGRKWSIICARSTAGATTFTFDAQYVLSAAVAPANGNRVNLLLEYNPVDDKVYEIGRAATAN